MNFLILFILLNKTTIPVSCPVFSNNGNIPSKYTCEGLDISPAIVVGEVPKGTKSLAIIVDDPDAPNGIVTHWISWNISPDTHQIAEGAKPGVQGKNEKGQLGYMGPCPSSGEHHYYFKVYALNKMLDLKSGASKNDLLNAINGFILGEGELVGLYKMEKVSK